MGRSRKYQVSIGLSSDLIDIIEKAVDNSNHTSRSAFLEDLIRENIQDRCIRCEIHDILVHHNLRERLPDTMQLAQELIQNRATVGTREQEKVLIEVVTLIQNQSGQAADLMDVLMEAQRLGISRERAEDIVDKMCREGRMIRPAGYTSLQVV